MGSQLEATAAVMSDCMGVRLPWDMLDGHGPLPGQGPSTEAGAAPRPHSLPDPGAKPRHLGTEKGHFENITRKCFSSHSVHTATSALAHTLLTQQIFPAPWFPK